MADTKVSALTAVVTPAGTDEIPVNQAGTSKKLTANQLKTLPFPAGGAGAGTWPKLTSGTLLTTPEAGAIELDANCLYGTSDAGNRGIIPIEHLIRCDSVHTLNNVGTAQPIFNSPTNGQITLETGTYLFELMFLVTAMSATSGNAQILFAGTGTFGAWLWRHDAIDGVAGTTLLDLDNAFNVTNATAAPCCAAAVNTTLRFYARGSFECTGAGTLIPQITLATAIATAAVAIGSFCLVRRVGSTSVVSVGQWD